MANANNAAVVEISQTAGKFRSSIVLKYESKYIDAKSILGLYTTLLDAGSYELHVHGPDEEEARKAILEIFAKHDLQIKVVD